MEREIFRMQYVRTGGIRGLDCCNFTVRERETVALVGDNLSGNQTACDIITGKQKITSGNIYIDGLPVEHYDKERAIREGIYAVVAEDDLVDGCTVADNLFVFAKPDNFSSISYGKIHEQTEKLLQEWGIPCTAGDDVSDLSPYMRFMICVLKRVIRGCRIIVFQYSAGYLTRQAK